MASAGEANLYDDTVSAFGDAASKPARAVVLVAQAYVAWLARCLRYMGRASLSSATYGRVLAWQLGAMTLGQRSDVRVLVDESVAQLRDLGEMSVQEALSLQKLLRRLGEELRALGGRDAGRASPLRESEAVGGALRMPDVDLQRTTAGIVAELGFETEVGRLQSAIERWIADASDEIRAELRWQFLGSSKFYRPLTVFACYRAIHGPQTPDEVIRAAVAVELFHNMSLIVDDILDRSRERRGKATLHCRFGRLPALMTSGYVVADGYRLVIDDPWSIELLSELMKRLGVAECMQWRLRRKPLGVEDWRMIAGEDTGSMFEVCACLGARSEELRRFGHLLGLIYHGCDDVADVRGLQALGGGGMEDVRDGILTLPAALAIRDPAVADLFISTDTSTENELMRAFEAQLPEAERYLDGIADQARKEAGIFSNDASGLMILVDKVRGLSST